MKRERERKANKCKREGHRVDGMTKRKRDLKHNQVFSNFFS